VGSGISFPGSFILSGLAVVHPSLGQWVVGSLFLGIKQAGFETDCFPPPDVGVCGVPRDFFPGGRGSTNSVEDRGQRERGSGGGSRLVRSSTRFANSETRILIRLLWMYFHGTGNLAQVCQNFRI
jgi:hypothetical protein